VDGEVLSNGVGSEAGVGDGVGVSAKLAGAEAPANLAAGAGAGAGDELLEPATVELLAALVDGEVLSNGVESEAGVRDGVGVSAKLAGAEAPANLAAAAGAGAPAKLADAFVGAGSPKASKLLQDGGVDERRFCFSCFPTDGRIEGTLPPTTIL
jgi:hypothetical protein